MDDRALKNTIRAVMDDELAARGWSKCQAQKVSKYYDGKGLHDYWPGMNSCQIFVLWSDEHLSRYAPDNKLTAGWEACFSSVCSALEQRYADMAPIKIDARKVKPLWQRPLKAALELLLQHATINMPLKP